MINYLEEFLTQEWAFNHRLIFGAGREWIPSRMDWDLLEAAKQIIAIPSVTTEGNRALVEYLAPFCRKVGLKLTFQGLANGGDDLNLIAHSVPEGSTDLCPAGLLFVTHLDTVPPGERSLWTETGGDPFCATIKGDKIYGLGSADTKLDFLCKLQAVEAVGVKHLKIPFCLIGTYGEERALAGVRRLRESGIVHPRFALIGEPSELQPVVKHKGILYMKVRMEGGVIHESPLQTKTFHGRAAHGSTPHLGENAIEKALFWLFEEQRKRPTLQLVSIEGGTVHNIVPEKSVVGVAEGRESCPQIEFLRKFWRLIQLADQTLQENSDLDFDPPVTTRNIGVIRSQANRMEIEFDYRLIPATDGNSLFRIFQELEHVPDTKVEVISSNAPMNTPRDSEIVRRVTETLLKGGLPAAFHVKSGNTEGAILSQMGAEAIVIGPGQSTGNIHKPNEHNRISQLKKAVEFYTALLRQF